MVKFWKSKKQQARLLAFAVFIDGALLITATLAGQLNIRNGIHISDLDVQLPLLLGISLLYLSSLLARGKQTAWLISIIGYGIAFIFRVAYFVSNTEIERHGLISLLHLVVLPLVIITALLLFRKAFTVKSDTESFTLAVKFGLIALIATLLYGVVGFLTLDIRDFHQEISTVEALHRTVDQFDLTTTGQLKPYTLRARLFEDSLSVFSLAAIAYVLVSFFQPVRAKLVNQDPLREELRQLLQSYPSSSEDFFKLWPEDKHFYFSKNHQAAIAYHERNGVALSVGDPVGNHKEFNDLVVDFNRFCRANDWLPAFVHTEPKRSILYKKRGFRLQKIGEEAIVNVENFNSQVRSNKYFRHINNKFTKQDYVVERLQPPHNEALILRLTEITRDWLAQPGRAERGLMMGYFTEAYMQKCNIFVVKDAAGTIRAFLNQVPTIDKAEANFDMLRAAENSLSNINDYLMLGFIDQITSDGFTTLNMGLCPLSGMKNADEPSGVIDSALHFVYSNGDRLYSFSGLRRFKAKYEPNWEDRYIAYKGGLRGLTRTVNALNGSMKVKQK